MRKMLVLERTLFTPPSLDAMSSEAPRGSVLCRVVTVAEDVLPNGGLDVYVKEAADLTITDPSISDLAHQLQDAIAAYVAVELGGDVRLTKTRVVERAAVMGDGMKDGMGNA